MAEGTKTSPELGSIQTGFEYWTNMLNVIEGAIDQYAGTGEIPDEATPDGWQPVWDVKTGLKNPEFFTLENATRYFELSVRQEAATAAITGKEPRSVADRFNDFLYTFEEQNVGEIIAQEPADGILHQALLGLLQERSKNEDVLIPPLKALKDLYGTPTAVELLGVQDGEYGDHVKAALKTPNALKWIHHLDNKEKGEMEWGERKEWFRDWITSGLGSYLSIGRDEAYEYTFSAAVKMEPNDLIDIINKFDHFGIDAIRNLTKQTGIHGLEAYSVDQLERMVEFASDPQTLSEKLKKHDTTVVMINRVGDHNGVMRSVAQEVDDEAGRVLFFEINNMSDIYRKMVSVAKSGIKPSSLVFSAHSNEGQFMVSDDRDPTVKKRDIAAIAGRKLVQMVNGSEDLEINPEGQKGYSMHGMKGMSRLVDQFMQPSRVIDDNASDKGRKKIIFWACYAGKETAMADLDETGEKTQIGEESVASRLGRDLVETGSQSKVDIYGGADGIQMHRTKYGLRYSSQPKGLGLGREDLHATRVRVESGDITKENIDEIPMRRAA